MVTSGGIIFIPGSIKIQPDCLKVMTICNTESHEHYDIMGLYFWPNLKCWMNKEQHDINKYVGKETALKTNKMKQGEEQKRFAK